MSWRLAYIFDSMSISVATFVLFGMTMANPGVVCVIAILKGDTSMGVYTCTLYAYVNGNKFVSHLR